MAYVLSNHRQDDKSCSGQHLFKFNPVTFESSPVWIMKTTGSHDCGHLGLTFDSTETLLFAFSRSNDKSTISLLDSDGNSKWQYETPDGNGYTNNLIKYKSIDASTNMIIATSGY